MQISHWTQFSREVREWAAAAVEGSFPWHATVLRHFGGEGRRVLIVHNIADGQGDEMVRCVPLVLAFLDFNPTLRVVVIARRAYLFSHPRIAVTDIFDRDGVEGALQQSFDAVVNFYESQITELNHNPGLEPRIEEYRAVRRPFLFASSTKGLDEGTFQMVEVDGKQESLGTDRPDIPNIYELRCPFDRRVRACLCAVAKTRLRRSSYWPAWIGPRGGFCGTSWWRIIRIGVRLPFSIRSEGSKASRDL